MSKDNPINRPNPDYNNMQDMGVHVLTVFEGRKHVYTDHYWLMFAEPQTRDVEVRVPLEVVVQAIDNNFENVIEGCKEFMKVYLNYCGENDLIPAYKHKEA